ncbi:MULTISPECIES: SulP family inorganic anion transporter [Vibrio]|uniref:SulP family inorganic anion transporter n=10 Tax=Gammaproteobacteria TaxID=1236 RepID=A0A0H0YC63_VIBAL|nr:MULTISPECIES: SulP family inorganic anion transporter [Vibrio]MCF7511194.1 SulP family inorganic anion transporter [Vibrio sp. D54]MCK8109698.1 SulP family inorganic anion transporter [Vibrio sp. 2CM40D]MDK9733423.1 SulP family inorganic anion transporter [Vibrio sp. B511a]MDK9794150.1 SulP family inorganic anion transporter [Vibrio sp. D431a]MDW1807734.1 SulP family inorganic anion transporter [Vibrio sp. Vb2362]MDW1970212.1 SulP family inorganic anion transporter [Vibrio sp. 945]MDW2258
MFGSRFEDINFKGDVFGGVTTAIISLPLALAFGVASGAGAEAGLWGAIMVGLFASLFGGSNTLISEPTGPMTVIMTAVLTSMMAKYPETGMAMTFTVVMMAGAFQILLGTLKLGKYVTLMPYSVISGFMSGIGVILIILQLSPLMGHAAPSGGVLGTLSALPETISNLKFSELFLGLLTLGILFFFPKQYRKYVPAQLVALVAVTLLSVILFDTEDIRRIGEIPAGLPSLVAPYIDTDMFVEMVIDALVLGTLGCIDTLLTAVIGDSLTRKEHDSDKELRGQGLANMISGLFGALPGAGATMGTVTNIQVGARSPLSGVIRALMLALVVLVAGGLTEPIPMAVLAGIAVYVGFNILDWSFIQRAHKVSFSGMAVMYGVMLLTVFVDLIVAVGLGVFISNIIIIERLSREQARQVKAISDADEDDVPLTDSERGLLDRANGKVLFFYLSGPMIFSVSKAISRQHSSISDYDVMILDLTDVPMIDVTVGLALENAIKDALDANCAVYLLCPNERTREQLEKFHVIDLVPDENMYQFRYEALNAAVAHVEADQYQRITA